MTSANIAVGSSGDSLWTGEAFGPEGYELGTRDWRRLDRRVSGKTIIKKRNQSGCSLPRRRPVGHPHHPSTPFLVCNCAFVPCQHVPRSMPLDASMIPDHARKYSSERTRPEDSDHDRSAKGPKGQKEETRKTPRLRLHPNLQSVPPPRLPHFLTLPAGASRSTVVCLAFLVTE